MLLLERAVYVAVMRRLDDSSPEAEIRDLSSILSEALVPRSGPADTTQGQLLRAQGSLTNECFQNGMTNYYGQVLEPCHDSYVEQLDLLLDVLPADDYLTRAKAKILEDRKGVPEASALQDKAEHSPLTEAEAARLEALCVFEAWEDLFDHTERMVLNYCIEHPLPRFAHLLQRDDMLPSVPQDGPGWLGLQVTSLKSGLRVDGVHAQSPAAGSLRPGDVIDWIDGYRTATMDGAGWAMKLLGGPEGSTAFLRVGPKLVRVVRVKRVE